MLIYKCDQHMNRKKWATARRDIGYFRYYITFVQDAVTEQLHFTTPHHTKHDEIHAKQERNRTEAAVASRVCANGGQVCVICPFDTTNTGKARPMKHQTQHHGVSSHETCMW